MTQNSNDFLGYLKHVKNKVNPFLEKYPKYVAPLSNLFLRTITLFQANKDARLALMTPFENLRERVEITYNLNKKSNEAAHLQIIFHEITLIAFGLSEVTNKSEIEEIKKYFNGLKPAGSLEEFLIKKFKLKNPHHEPIKDPQLLLIQNLSSMSSDIISSENFKLNAVIDDQSLNNAIKAYFKSIGGKVKFQKYRNYFFDYEIKDKKGSGHISNFDNNILITLMPTEY